MAKQWTDEEVKAEIRAAVQIVREDRERAEYARLHGVYGQSSNGGDGSNGGGNGGQSGGNPPAPPKKEGDGTEGVDPGPKKGLWWGDALNE